MIFHLSLLNWYDVHCRRLPWRALPGQHSEPYHVWLSEIMLQQTTVSVVIPYFHRFCARWPTISDLAGAPLDDILREWAGLGYYARARNLHACARRIVVEYGGVFPATEAELLQLPGIGPYTAAAISAIAFERQSVVVDGNIERIMARLNAVETPLPRARSELRRQAATLTPPRRGGDYAQALMDLGAQICRPKSPRCQECPVQSHCTAQQLGKQTHYPVRAARKARPVRYGRIYWLQRGDGKVLLRRRKLEGLLGGMMEFPSSDWNTQQTLSHAQAPARIRWRKLPAEIRHVFSHFELRLSVYKGRLETGALIVPSSYLWAAQSAIAAEALPSVMRKVLEKCAPQ